MLALGRSLLTPGQVEVLGFDRVVHGGHPLIASVLAVAWDVVAVAWLFSVFCVVIAARRADLQVGDLRGGVWLAQAMAIVVFVATLAAFAWGIGVSHQPPIPRADLIGSVAGVRPWTGIETSIAAWWPLVAGALAGVSLVTSWAALSARRGYKTARKLLVLAG